MEYLQLLPRDKLFCMNIHQLATVEFEVETSGENLQVWSVSITV